MSAIKFIQGVARKSLTKNQGSGITTIPGAMQSEAKAAEIVALLQKAGIPMNQLDDFIRSEADVLKFLNIIESASKPKVYSGQAAIDQLNKIFPKKGEVVDMTGKKIDTSQGIMGGKSVKELMESGQVQKGSEGLKKGQKITDRDMFNNSSLNKIDPNSELGKSIKMEAEAEKRLKKLNMSDKEINLRGDRPYDTDAQIKARLEAGNKKSSTNIKNNRQLTDEEIRDYELELGDSETWLNKGTFGEAEQALKNQKAYEAKMFEEYKSIGGSRRPGGPKASEKDSLPMRLTKNFEKELDVDELLAEGYSKDQAEVLFRAREKMKLGQENNPNEALLRVKEEFADKAGVDVDDFTDIDFEIDIPDYAKGGRAGYYTGGITDVEPSLDDIGHGSDALMARTRLMSPGAQATTSTGLNYLLAEDNDNMRVPFSAGGGGRRAFLKLLASIGGGAAAFKSGLLSLGEGGTKKAVTETVKQAAGSGGQVPPYFLNLVKKIKNLGDDAPRLATQDRQKVTKYKDFEMTEDITTGEIQIFKKSQSDEAINRFGGENATEEVFMKYKPSETIIGKNNKPVKTGPEYEENTSYISNNRENTGGILDDVDGVPDEVVQEGTVFEDTLSEFGKADGGRIGFSGGGIFRAIIAKSAAKKGLSVTDFIKATNYKGLPPEIRMYISPEDFAKLKGGQKELYDNYIDMAKTRLEFQKNVEGGMKTPEVAPFFKNLEKTMDEQSFVPKTVTADDIAQMELMVKNRFNKGRKDNAQGGIQTMLGE
jgi:hypothetical protein